MSRGGATTGSTSPRRISRWSGSCTSGPSSGCGFRPPRPCRSGNGDGMSGDFDPPVSAVREAVARALAEDLGVLGDLTSTALIPADAVGTGHFVARVPGVLAGTATAGEVFAQLDPVVTVEWAAADGDRLSAGQRVGTVTGPLRSLLTGERAALNFLGHLSGIATLTRAHVD